MKAKKRKLTMQRIALSFLLLVVVFSGCKKNDPEAGSTGKDNSLASRPHPMNLRGFEQINLVSDVAEYNPRHIDVNLVNAWGIAFSATGIPWISSADKGLSVIYDTSGNTVRPPVSIPFHGDPNGGNPTGVVFNSTQNFIISANSERSKFIFATENGTIAAWSSGNSAITVADRSAYHAVYKGLALATTGTANYLYATNFKGGAIDVFDQSFNYVSMPIVDPGIPAGFAPFGIQTIGGKLYVTYAKQLGPDNRDDESGPGNGYVSIFNPDGSFVRRFASQGVLNSPWGIAMVPEQHNQNPTILIGNFGDGHINAFDANGTVLGHLTHGNQDIELEGLWGIAFASNDTAEGMRLYFTAGPDDEEHGLFGVLSRE